MVDELQTTVTVVGGSMFPFILSGSRLSVERVPVEQIRVGDVICYIDDDGRGTAHRVFSKSTSTSGTTIFARGDAGNIEEEIPQESITFVARYVKHRLLSYETDGVVGRLFARVALEEKLTTRAIKYFFSRCCRFLLKIKQSVC